jgi:hypothetical protein
MNTTAPAAAVTVEVETTTAICVAALAAATAPPTTAIYANATVRADTAATLTTATVNSVQ